jgi:RNA polymerase sigma factor (sigma-70 family)
MPETQSHFTNSHLLVEHFFRHEYGRLVGALTRHFGLSEVDLVEDAVQTSLQRALKTWSHRGIPEDPARWLFRTAKNAAIDSLRRRKRGKEILQEPHVGEAEAYLPNTQYEDDLLADDRLRMLFLCADPKLAVESQIAFALKIVAGFSVAEIARALLVSESTIQKRITRAKEKLREIYSLQESDKSICVKQRFASVQTVIYLIFNEGYFSFSEVSTLRRDLCDEAIRLAMLLESHRGEHQPSTYALLALMYFCYGRFESRTIKSDTPVLLENQDRSRWDWGMFRQGLHWHIRSAHGNKVSRFHMEAAIAWEHCRAPNLESTDWKQIRKLYLALKSIVDSNSVRIGLAVAEYFIEGILRAKEVLSEMANYSLALELAQRDSLLGWMYQREGDNIKATEYFRKALQHPIPEIQRLAIAQLSKSLAQDT